MRSASLILLLVSFALIGCSQNSSSNDSYDGDQDQPEQEFELEDETEQKGEEADDTPQAPSDDPADYRVDTSKTYKIQVSDPRWVVPSDGLPSQAPAAVSNANVDIQFFGEKLYMAWRAAPFHFAGNETLMHVVSSTDGGHTWDYEATVDKDTDVREPRFLVIDGQLQLTFFEAGTDMFSFEPKRLWRMFYQSPGSWTEPEIMLDSPEVLWDVKTRNGKVYMTSYRGNHYDVSGESLLEVRFKYSADGINWHPIDGNEGVVYTGGVSEVAFEFDAEGNLWAVTRNEDGDDSGFGAHVCFAPKNALSEWECSERSDPNRYDSPEMFRHGEEIYLVARRDVGGPYDEGRDDLSFEEQKSTYLMNYSLRPKGTALYRINRDERKVEKLFDLPGCGDNAFPSVRRLGTHEFLMANYTNPLDMTDSNWLNGQTSSRGTQIYLMTISFIQDE